jgi:hypothetical protein
MVNLLLRVKIKKKLFSLQVSLWTVRRESLTYRLKVNAPNYHWLCVLSSLKNKFIFVINCKFMTGFRVKQINIKVIVK